MEQANKAKDQNPPQLHDKSSTTFPPTSLKGLEQKERNFLAITQDITFGWAIITTPIGVTKTCD